MITLVLFSSCSRSLLSGSCATKKSLPDTAFYFIQASDVHWGDSLNNLRFESWIASVKRLPIRPAFALITGDMLYNPCGFEKTREYGVRFKELGFPVFFTPGNHDLPSFGDTAATSHFKNAFGPLDTAFTQQGIRFIGFNSAWLGDTACLECPEIFKTLSQKIDASPFPVILFTHIPPAGNFYKNNFHEGWVPDFYKQFITPASREPVFALLCGHFHRDEMANMGTTPIYIAGPLARNLDRQAQYRLYHYQNGTLSYFTVFLKDDE